MRNFIDKNWLLDELSHAGLEHLDANYVQSYDHKAQFDPTEDINCLARYGLSQESTVIDIGAGTGNFALAIAQHCELVIAVEPSPAMRSRMKKLREDKEIKNVNIVAGGFLTYHHTGKPADYIFTRNALHHLPDFWKSLALARMHSMLGRDGIVQIRDLIFDFNPESTKLEIESWLAGATDDASMGWTADELAEHVRDEFSTYSWLFEVILAKTGFKIIERAFQRKVYGRYTCRKRTEQS